MPPFPVPTHIDNLLIQAIFLSELSNISRGVVFCLFISLQRSWILMLQSLSQLMDVVKGKWKKNLISKAWKRCRSLGTTGSSSSIPISCVIKSQLRKCSTAPSERKQKSQVAPDGCFSVYVGPEKQRFVVRTEFSNHPLFKLLLDDAELEYGFNSEGPILLPCDVDLFYNALAEMESCEVVTSPNCSLMLRSPCCPKYTRINNTTSYKLRSP